MSDKATMFDVQVKPIVVYIPCNCCEDGLIKLSLNYKHVKRGKVYVCDNHTTAPEPKEEYDE